MGLLLSKVGTLPDTASLREAVAGSGIDPRLWCSYAVITDKGWDDDEGLIVDVTLLPTGETEHARVGQISAGAGFGIYIPIEVDDLVIVGIPSGDPDEGLTVLCRVYSPSHKPPTEFKDQSGNPSPNTIIFVKKDTTLKMITDGAGDIVIVPRGTGKVKLGDENVSAPLDGVVHGTGIDTFTGQTYAALQNASSKVLAKK